MRWTWLLAPIARARAVKRAPVGASITTQTNVRNEEEGPMFARMVIGECLSEAQLREFLKIYENDVTPQLGKEPGYAASQLLVEEGGCMVIALTTWATREDCLRYHSSRNYRQ